MNRILGIIFTVVAIAVMVFAILNWGNYKSLCFKGGDDLETIDENSRCEIAFFGGSFTGIDPSLMTELLEIAHEYVGLGKVSGIRCSTRPDYIDEDILLQLKKYGVKVIELGLQSADERVLSLTKRGHDFSAEKRACKLIKDSGFSLVGQMMIGLPGANEMSE